MNRIIWKSVEGNTADCIPIPAMYCPLCGSKIFRIFKRTKLLCRDCGILLAEAVVSK